MRWQNRRQSSNVEDRRGRRGAMGTGKGGGIIGLIVVLVGMYYGVDLSGLVGAPQLGGAASSSLDAEQEEYINRLSRTVLAETEDSWTAYFARNGQSYRAPVLVLYTGATQSACGTGQSAMGPFYCPGDEKIYLDLSFYEDMKRQLAAQGGDAAFSYVIAHEVGHHVQNLLGILPQVHRAQQRSDTARANQLSVRLELQADCFAGVWAHSARQHQLFEGDDVSRILNAAEAVGDDRIQNRSQGYAVPDSFTHGSSAERKAWFQRGFASGDAAQCDTFAPNNR